MKEFTFEEFKNRVIVFWRENLQSMGYEYPDFSDLTLGIKMYSVSFTRYNPRKKRREFTLDLIWDEKSGFEVNEHFEDLSDIPAEYGDMHEDKNRPEWEQPPMFIYGTFKRFGDALNSLKKGDSINLRPYKELYY